MPPMTHILPRSLSTRMVLIMLGIILLVQMATFVTVSYYRKEFTENVTVEFAATTIRALRASLAQLPPEYRADFVRAASRNTWYLWSRGLPPEARLEERRRNPPPPLHHRPPNGHPPNGPPPVAGNDIRTSLRGFVDALNRELDDDARVALSRGAEPRLYISLISSAIPEDSRQYREWLVIPLNRLPLSVSTPVIMFWIGGMGALLLLAALFAWHITRPLTRLARAADQLAQGKPERVEPSGPTETRLLAERFNLMLDRLEESRNVQRTLLAGLPHDLKGPLSRMWLRVEMLDDPAVKEGMLKDVQDMQRMVNQFIGYVRGSDPGSYQFAPLVLNTWLEEQTSAWESAGSPVQLAETGTTPLMINGDRLALGRLLDNLVSNALNHGKPPVEVRLRQHNQDAIITIRDHGPGIEPARRAEALRPFSRLDEARTRTGSVGLGLALAEMITRAHGGVLRLDNAPDAGLEVVITLPLLSGDPP